MTRSEGVGHCPKPDSFGLVVDENGVVYSSHRVRKLLGFFFCRAELSASLSHPPNDYRSQNSRSGCRCCSQDRSNDIVFEPSLFWYQVRYKALGYQTRQGYTYSCCQQGFQPLLCLLVHQATFLASLLSSVSLFLRAAASKQRHEFSLLAFRACNMQRAGNPEKEYSRRPSFRHHTF
jgi:hypothetical protein